MSKHLGASSGSRASTEPQSVSALAGFDPAREIVELLTETREAIASLEVDALGWDGCWPVREGLLHRIDSTLAKWRGRQ